MNIDLCSSMASIEVPTLIDTPQEVVLRLPLEPQDQTMGKATFHMLPDFIEWRMASFGGSGVSVTDFRKLVRHRSSLS